MTVIGLRRGFSSPSFEQGNQSEFDQFVNSVLRDVAELPDRTSPDDEPDMMLVTADELKAILCNRLSETLNSAATLVYPECEYCKKQHDLRMACPAYVTYRRSLLT